MNKALTHRMAVIANLRARVAGARHEMRHADKHLIAIEEHRPDEKSAENLRVLAFLTENDWEAWSPSEIMAATLLNSEVVRKSLTRLKAAGYVAKSGHARWKAVP